MTSRPRVLILSASDKEPLDVAHELQRQLDHACEPTVWTQNVFRAGHSILASFARAVESHAYGVFVLTPDDILQRGEELALVPRMNVVFELGYFAAKHGIERAFLLAPRGEKLHYLSDLAGIQPVDFNLERFRKGEQAPALGAAVGSILSAISADRLDYPREVQGRNNLLAMTDAAPIAAGKHYCLAAKLGGGHAVRLRLLGTPREPGGELNFGWSMSLRPSSVAWDNSTGIVDSSQSFWASGPSEAFTDFRVSSSCKELIVEIYENSDALDKQNGTPQCIKKFQVLESS